MQFGSTSRNVNLLTIFTTIITVIGFFNVEMFTTSNILISVASFYILNILGIWMMLHRYYSHRSFRFRSVTLKWIFTSIAILAGRGSPLGWVYLHRKHHRYSDTEKDPHSPKNLGYKLFGFSHMRTQEESKMELFLVKDLMSKEHLFIHKWYMAIMIIFIFMFIVINPVLFYFVWAVPAIAIQLGQNNFNYFGHTNGYRNFETKDNSRNNAWLFPLILGEAWHNNHHHNPASISTRELYFEVDPVEYLIRLVRRKDEPK